MTVRTEGIIDRFESAGLIVEIAQVVMHEGDEPDVLVDLLDADLLSPKHLTDVNFAALIADPAAGGDHGGAHSSDRPSGR